MDTHLHHICLELYICRSVSHHYSTVNKHFIFFDFSFRPQGSIPLDFHTQDWWLVVTDESVTGFQVDNRRGWKSCVNEEEIKTWWGALIQKAQWAQVKQALYSARAAEMCVHLKPMDPQGQQWLTLHIKIKTISSNQWEQYILKSSSEFWLLHERDEELWINITRKYFIVCLIIKRSMTCANTK